LKRYEKISKLAETAMVLRGFGEFAPFSHRFDLLVETEMKKPVRFAKSSAFE